MIEKNPERDDLTPDYTLITHFLSPETADQYFNTLSNELEWRQDQIKMFGKLVAIPRLQNFMGDPGIRYRYSGLTLTASGWHPVVKKIKELAEAASNTEFNAVLINLYRDGQDSMGWHKDDEPELGPEPTIVSVSLGATRRFLLRAADKTQHELLLNSGSLLVMGPELQKHWQHSIPKTRKQIGPRINLTFRKIVQ